MLWNYLYLSQELIDTKHEQSKQRLLTIIKQNSVISWRHINFYGEYDFTVINENNDNKVFDLEKISKLKIA